VIFVHAVEVDQSLASHLVGPDPLLGDQLISLRLSEFAIATTVLELDEPALLAVVIVGHGSCKCFDELRHNRIKTRWASWYFHAATWCRRARAETALLPW
jgi:hypothetical protein